MLHKKAIIIGLILVLTFSLVGCLGSGGGDWPEVPAFINDENTLEDDTSLVGSDLESVKLALSSDKERLNVLIKANNEDISNKLWYRLFFDNNLNRDISEYK